MNDAMTLKDEGLNLYRDGRYAEAAAKFVEAQQAFVAQGNPSEAAQCVNNRGVCLRQAAKFDEAAAAFDEARPMFQAVNDPVGEAQVVGNMAALADAQGDKDRAEQLYHAAIEMFDKAGAKDFVKDTYTALSKMKLKQRDIVGAMTAFDAGLEQLDKPNLIERMARKIIGGGASQASSDEKDEGKT
jgi:tetratricopeptide (TPR) repeat protein